jgi:hypothetical protein
MKLSSGPALRVVESGYKFVEGNLEKDSEVFQSKRNKKTD